MIELKKITKIYKTKNQKDVYALNNLDYGLKVEHRDIQKDVIRKKQ